MPKTTIPLCIATEQAPVVRHSPTESAPTTVKPEPPATAKPPTPLLSKEQIDKANVTLEGRGHRHFTLGGGAISFPRLTMATAFGAEGNCIIHMLAEIEPRVRIFNLETGYQFKETLEVARTHQESLWHRSRISFGRSYRCRNTRQSMAARFTIPSPDQCCHDRKSIPLRQGSRRLRCLDQRHPQGPDQGPGTGGRRRLGRQVQPGEDQPASAMDQEGRLELHRQDMTCRTIRCMTKATPASAAGPALAPSPMAKTTAPAAGSAPSKKSAACT